MLNLLAPNGKPSNLTPEQYSLVRTAEFKEWFGDWEKLAYAKMKDAAMDEVTLANLSKNVSDVLDSNGEPLVVYRGQVVDEHLGYTFQKGLNILRKPYKNEFGFFFSKDKVLAEGYADYPSKGKIGYVLEVFLFAKTLDLRPLGLKYKSGIDFVEYLESKGVVFSDENRNNLINIQNLYDIGMATGYQYDVWDIFDLMPEINQDLINSGYTAVLFFEKRPSTFGEVEQYAVFNSNQIKLADGTNTTFDSNNPDIRYEMGGKIKKGKGDCYYVAGQFAMGALSPKKIKYIGTPYIVHAEVQGQGKVSDIRYGHAWVEDDELIYDFSNNREIVFPKQLYYAIGDIKTDNPKKYRKYTFDEARKKMVETKHYGCWDLEVDYAEGGEITEQEKQENLNKFIDSSLFTDNSFSYRTGKAELESVPKIYFHETLKSNLKDIEENGFDTNIVISRGNDNLMPNGIFLKNTDKEIGVGGSGDKIQIPVYVSVKWEKVNFFEDRDELYEFAVNKNPDFHSAYWAVENYDKKMSKFFDEFFDYRNYFSNYERGTDAYKKRLQQFSDETEEYLREWDIELKRLSAISREITTEIFTSLGIEAIVIRNDTGSFGRKVWTLVVLNPYKIKAVNNIGTFDETKKGIKYEVGGNVVTEENKNTVVPTFVDNENKLQESKKIKNPISKYTDVIKSHLKITTYAHDWKFYDKPNAVNSLLDFFKIPIRVKKNVGEGSYGVAFLTDKKTVLKITNNANEAYSSFVIMKNRGKLKTQADVYNVFKITNGEESLYLIEKQFIPEIFYDILLNIDKDISQTGNIYQKYLDEVFHQCFYYSENEQFYEMKEYDVEKLFLIKKGFIEDELQDDSPYIKLLTKKDEQVIDYAKSIKQFFIDLQKDEKTTNIDFADIHSGNAGFIDKKFVCFDCAMGDISLFQDGGKLK
jgi:hypothetical protein